MSTRQKIKNLCKDVGVELLELKNKRESEPSPSGYGRASYWYATIKFNDGEVDTYSCDVDGLDELLDDIEYGAKQ